MICPPCKKQKHKKCTNPETCPCQHRKLGKFPAPFTPGKGKP